jgi:nucleoside-diphosphate-sugar epimerase
VRVLVLGAAGMIGRKLAARLSGDARLVDLVPEPGVEGADLAEPGVAARLVADRPDLIFHLAAVVSGEAEADFEKGYRVNLDGLRNLLEGCRALDGYRPRLVFTSSIAVFGAPFPDPIPDAFHTTPLTSYGTEKAIGELLLGDYSRRGFVDGIALRLPTITVRPGAPNLAASGFFSSLIREPLNGREAVLPVPDTVRHWHASPRSAVGFLLHAAELDTSLLEGRRALTMPGVSATVAEQIEALRRVGGDEAVALIRRDRDETIARIVGGWPERFDARRALELGFRTEASFDEIVQAYVEDDLGR